MPCCATLPAQHWKYLYNACILGMFRLGRNSWNQLENLEFNGIYGKLWRICEKVMDLVNCCENLVKIMLEISL